MGGVGVDSRCLIGVLTVGGGWCRIYYEGLFVFTHILR